MTTLTILLPDNTYDTPCISDISVPKATTKSRILCRYPTSNHTVTVSAHRPRGMRLVDMEILTDVFACLKCSDCGAPLDLYEHSWEHGWSTRFIVKCHRCSLVVSEFPSSRPLEKPRNETCVNVSLPVRQMTDVTMRSVLTVHSTGMSWRDLHKFATIFDMPPPLTHMPVRYLERLDALGTQACHISMLSAAHNLRSRVDAQPSPEPNAINVIVVKVSK